MNPVRTLTLTPSEVELLVDFALWVERVEGEWVAPVQAVELYVEHRGMPLPPEDDGLTRTGRAELRGP